MKTPEPNPSGPQRSDTVEQFVDLELRLSVEERSASPRGYIRDPRGHQQGFRGWLGLLGLLEEATSRQGRGEDERLT
jgi:hypothetical protein